MLPHGVEDLFVQGSADVRAEPPQCGARKGILVAAEVLEADIAYLDHLQLFQVGVVVAPSLPLVVEQAVAQNVAQRHLGLLPLRDVSVGHAHIGGPDRPVIRSEPHRLEDRVCQIVLRKPAPVFLQRAPEPGAQHQQKDEVVEVSRLQGCVLTVIDKTQDFFILVVLPLELVHRRKGQDGGGRRTPLPGKPRKAVRVPALEAVGHAAVDAVAKLPSHIPERFTAPDPSAGVQENALRNPAPAGAFQLGLLVPPVIEPVVGEVVLALVARALAERSDKAIRSVLASACDVVDLPPLKAVSDTCDRVKFLPALAAEIRVKERDILILPIRGIDLFVEGHNARPGGLQSTGDPAGAADELVKFERERSLSRRGFEPMHGDEEVA